MASAIASKGPKMPPPAIIKALNHFWIDTHVDDMPDGISYGLYPQPTRGTSAQGSYTLLLPPGYDETALEKRYPVLYWLHGGMGHQRQADFALSWYGNSMREGKMPRTIVVGVQGLPVGWYANSVDGERPIRTIIARDLVKHIDSTYRTIDHPRARWIEGFSMGGYGSLHIGLSHPEVFGIISSIAGALLPRLDQEPPERTYDTFGNSQEAYEAAHPYTLLNTNRARLDDIRIRLLSGSADGRLTEPIARLTARLQEEKVDHKAFEVEDVDHDYPAILRGVGDFAWMFWHHAARRIPV